VHVLVMNSGSSSIKYELFDMDTTTTLASGLVERIGEDRGRARHRIGDDEVTEDDAIPDHDDGFRRVVAALEDAGLADDLGAIGHRVVHGGERFSEPTVLDDAAVEGIRAQIPLAPLHNPANVTGIEVARKLRPDLPQVAVFDTAFHRSIPPHAHRYAVPAEWYERHGVRRYGFHGTSHAFVARQAAHHLGRPLEEVDLITLHLGNGASATAISRGRSVDTSMGMSPLEGLVMGTRSGDIDPAVVFHVQREAGLTAEELETTLNKQSGLKGLCGDNDLREIERRAEAGDAEAALALAAYGHRVRKYIGAYLAVLGGADALVFTAGVGENSPEVRARVTDGLEPLGVSIDAERNAVRAPSEVAAIHDVHSAISVLVVPTDEEREIAEQTVAAVSQQPSKG